jgi:DNA-binding HxlR family transcriptional regulator
MAGKRNYGDPCGVARALDVIGERWTLLIVRELLHGPKRFTDLRAGLPNASQNVLSHRLDELERGGVLRRTKLGPPASTWVYELTERGQALKPVVIEIGRWGSRIALDTTEDMSVDALIVALETTFDPRGTDGREATFELRLDDDRFRVEVSGGSLTIARGAASQPDATFTATSRGFRSLVFGGQGDVAVDGDRDAAAWFVRLFPRPTPA